MVDPDRLGAYRESGGYETLTRAITMGRRGVIEALEQSGLKGRGGAAFPIGLKWRGVADASGDLKYVIANGDESEPGTFKDRILMEGDPFAVVEAMTIAGFVTGAGHGFAYVRGEYPIAERRLIGAVEQAREAGLLGPNVADAGFDFDIEVRRGAGAYICGEETALFASIEGHRGEPRQKPPFPTERGVFGKPTSVNNIETLVAALAVLEMGAEQFSSIGTERSTGPKLFCISGDVARPGLFEVPFGTTLRELIDLAGGVRDGNGVGAVLVGGAAGSFVDAGNLDMELTFEGAAAAQTSLGSGAVVVFDDTTDFGPVLRRLAQFFRDAPAHFDVVANALRGVYTLNASGAWELVAPTDLMRAGVAYWVYSEGGSDFLAPFEVRIEGGGETLDFGRQVPQFILRTINRRNTSVNATLAEIPAPATA